MIVGTSTEPQENIRQQLHRILSSKSFRQVSRLHGFLQFIVEQTLAGRGDKLKEFPIGVEAFDKEGSFDPRMDPIVRVQARRLRDRLDRYYREEGQNDEIFIDLPKGRYEPIFHQRRTLRKKRTVSSVLFRQNTIVILPYEDNSPDHNLGYFCNGLKHEIIHALLELTGVRVVAIPEAEQSGHDVGEQVNGALIVGGSVRKTRNALRIRSNLIDSQTNYYLWSDFGEADAEDVLGAHEQVAQRIVERLRAELFRNGGVGTIATARKSQCL
jgi:TolB-like protein